MQQLQHTHVSLNLLKTQQVLNDRFQRFLFGGRVFQLLTPYGFRRVHHRGYGLVELLAGMLAATAFKAWVLEMFRGEKIDPWEMCHGGVYIRLVMYIYIYFFFEMNVHFIDVCFFCIFPHFLSCLFFRSTFICYLFVERLEIANNVFKYELYKKVPGGSSTKKFCFFHVCRNHGWHQVCTENQLMFFSIRTLFQGTNPDELE